MNRMMLRNTAALLVTAILLITPNIALADGGEDGYIETSNGYQIELVFKEPAKTGENEFHVQITDSMGMSVPNAEVEVSCLPAENMSEHEESVSAESHSADSIGGMDMPTEAPTNDSMGGMVMATEIPSTGVMRPNSESAADDHNEEAIIVTLEPAHESGEYSGEISFDTSGAWVFNVHFTVNGEMTEVEIPIEVVRAGSNLGILAGFFGFNATVITVAAIMKRRPISK